MTRNFGTGTTGFCDVSDPETAICCLPGTELAFDAPVQIVEYYDSPREVPFTTAVFGQVDKEQPHTHHDRIEFADGTSVMLTRLVIGQHATVLQLPAAPTNEAEVKAQTRAVFAG